MYNFQGRPDQYAPVTRYHIVFENPSHLYSQAIYIVYNEKRKNKKKRKARSQNRLEMGEMLERKWGKNKREGRRGD